MNRIQMINKYLLVVICLIISNVLSLSAQEDPIYLEGAVPEVAGKVKFVREIKVDKNISTEQLFKYATEWANEEYKISDDSKQRILLENSAEHNIACQGDQYLTFSSSVISLDRARMTYQLLIHVERGEYKLEVQNIRYEYSDYKNLMPAEEMITDKVALNKNKNKLNRHYSKFRKATIDCVNEIEKSFHNFLTSKMGGTKSAEIVSPVQGSLALASGMAGYKQMNAAELSESVMAMFKDSWALVVEGKEGATKPMTAAWSGMGNLGGKPVSMVLVDSDNNDEEIYTISFFTPIHKENLDKIEKGGKADFTPITIPSGAVSYSEAWMIIECKKVSEQPASESMIENIQSKAWVKNDFNKLLMGEIVNVWAK